MNTKEKILVSTLELAAEYGLKSLSMSQIAEKVGIKKPSLYNHFTSKEVLIDELYHYIREKSKTNILAINPDDLNDKTAREILKEAVMNYQKISSSPEMLQFYKVIYSERTTNPDAARIMVEETEKMISATKELFKFLKVENAEIAATSFAMTVHGLIDFELDEKMAGKETNNKLQNYVDWFCDQYIKEEK